MTEMTLTSDGARRVTPWTQLHDWVRISGISPTASSLYWVMKMHVYVRAGDNSVKTSTDELAALCGLSRGDKVTRYVRELEGIGAVSSKLEGMPARKVYVVHEDPPPGYTGPLTLKEWYEIRRSVKALKERQNESEKPQVSAVPPESGEQENAPDRPSAKPQVSAVPPESGEQALLPPNGGLPVPPSRGHLQEEEVLQEATSSPSSALPHPESPTIEQEKETGNLPDDQDHSVVAAGQGLTAEEQDLFDECMTLRPDWSPTRLRQVLSDPDIRERQDRDLVRRAFLIGTQTGRTQPGRMLAKGCPHWLEAFESRRRESQPVPAVGAVAQAPLQRSFRPQLELSEDGSRARDLARQAASNPGFSLRSERR